MKVIQSLNKLGLCIFIGCLIGIISYSLSSKDSKVIVQNTEQSFPIRLTKTYEIISADFNEDILTIVIKDKFNGYEYKSTYPSDLLKKRICGSYVYRKNYWDCSNEYKTIKSMILELGYKSLKMIK